MSSILSSSLQIIIVVPLWIIILQSFDREILGEGPSTVSMINIDAPVSVKLWLEGVRSCIQPSVTIDAEEARTVGQSERGSLAV